MCGPETGVRLDLGRGAFFDPLMPGEKATLAERSCSGGGACATFQFSADALP